MNAKDSLYASYTFALFVAITFIYGLLLTVVDIVFSHYGFDNLYSYIITGNIFLAQYLALLTTGVAIAVWRKRLETSWIVAACMGLAVFFVGILLFNFSELGYSVSSGRERIMYGCSLSESTSSVTTIAGEQTVASDFLCTLKSIPIIMSDFMPSTLSERSRDWIAFIVCDLVILVSFITSRRIMKVKYINIGRKPKALRQ